MSSAGPNARAEIERKYESAARALGSVGRVTTTNDREREERLVAFLATIYSIMEYARGACERYDRAHGTTAAATWLNDERRRAEYQLFRKLRDVDQHAFATRYNHRVALSLAACAAITAKTSLRSIARHGLRLDRIAKELVCDPRLAWLQRRLPIAWARREDPGYGYAWGFAPREHNAQAKKSHQFDDAEIGHLENQTAHQVLADILGFVRDLIDDGLRRGFF
jgi:hypothetical protein